MGVEVQGEDPHSIRYKAESGCSRPTRLSQASHLPVALLRERDGAEGGPVPEERVPAPSGPPATPDLDNPRAARSRAHPDTLTYPAVQSAKRTQTCPTWLPESDTSWQEAAGYLGVAAGFLLQLEKGILSSRYFFFHLLKNWVNILALLEEATVVPLA